MYSIFVNVIKNEPYALNDMIKKIDVAWVKNEITEEERDELITMANENADPDYYIELENKVELLSKSIESIMATIQTHGAIISALKKAVEEGGTTVDPEPEPEPEEYPEWYAWDGVTLPCPWNKGKKCTHNGKKWVSQVDNNVWEPGGLGVHETIWKKVVE